MVCRNRKPGKGCSVILLSAARNKVHVREGYRRLGGDFRPDGAGDDPRMLVGKQPIHGRVRSNDRFSQPVNSLVVKCSNQADTDDRFRAVCNGYHVSLSSSTPAGHESNWLYTQPGQKWFPWFRLYGPEKPIFDKVWKLPDFEKVD